MVGRFVDLLLTDRGSRLFRLVALCWEAVDAALPLQLLTGSVAAEGLLRLAAGEQTPDTETVAGVSAVRSWLSQPPAGLSDRFCKRLLGMVGGMSRRRPDDILHDWARRGLLGVSSSDVDAWKRTRNPAAHGHGVDPVESQCELQVQLDRLAAVHNLINRIILQLAGYTGAYTDYARGRAEVPFPRADPASL